MGLLCTFFLVLEVVTRQEAISALICKGSKRASLFKAYRELHTHEKKYKVCQNETIPGPKADPHRRGQRV